MRTANRVLDGRRLGGAFGSGLARQRRGLARGEIGRRDDADRLRRNIAWLGLNAASTGRAHHPQRLRGSCGGLNLSGNALNASKRGTFGSRGTRRRRRNGDKRTRCESCK